jgi:flagellin
VPPDWNGSRLGKGSIQPLERAAVEIEEKEQQMPQIINTNILSMITQQDLNNTQTSLGTSVQRLSSGLRINSAMDDPAGLAIAQRMGSQVSGMQVAVRNSNDAISLSQVADGTLGTVSNMLQQMRDLAVQAANGTNGSSDLNNLQTEFNSLATEINRELSQTTFNGKAILGSDAGTTTYQVGANAGQTIQLVTTNLASDANVTTVTMDTTSLATGGSTAAAMITSIDTALTDINTQRANYGSAEAEFQGVISNLQTGVTNQSAAQSRIQDADYAQETANLTRAQILQQAGTAMLAQANALPQSVLKLLG